MAQAFETNFDTGTRSRFGVFGIILVIVLLLVVATFFFLYMNKSVKQPTSSQTGPMAEYMRPEKPVISPDVGNYDFDDGLGRPDSATRYQLDELGEGVASIEIFNIDINSDGQKDKITRTRHENGTDHFYYDYKIELNIGGVLLDITPDKFRTVEGAECSLQKLKFVFRPDFQVIKISRDWKDSWTTPTMASRHVYKLIANNLEATEYRPLKTVCNVSDLF